MKLKEAIEILKNYKFDMRQSGAVKAVKAITTIDKELEYIMELKERDTAEAAIITGYNRAVGCKVGGVSDMWRNDQGLYGILQ